jgi:hypothetical protein
MKIHSCISVGLAILAAHAMTTNAMAAKPTTDFFSNSPNIAAAFARINEPMAIDPAVAGGTTFRHAKNEYSLYLAGCSQQGGCKTLQVQACYDMPNVNLAKANAWNRERQFARAFLDSTGRLCLDIVHMMQNEKTNDASLAEILKLFLDVRALAPDFFNKP